MSRIARRALKRMTALAAKMRAAQGSSGAPRLCMTPVTSTKRLLQTGLQRWIWRPSIHCLNHYLCPTSCLARRILYRNLRTPRSHRRGPALTLLSTLLRGLRPGPLQRHLIYLLIICLAIPPSIVAWTLLASRHGARKTGFLPTLGSILLHSPAVGRLSQTVYLQRHHLRSPFITSTTASSTATTSFLVPFRATLPPMSALGTRIPHSRTPRCLRRAVSGGSRITPTMPVTSSSVPGRISHSSRITVLDSGSVRRASDFLGCSRPPHYIRSSCTPLLYRVLTRLSWRRSPLMTKQKSRVRVLKPQAKLACRKMIPRRL